MSEQSDYDRLRADVLALSKEVFSHGWGGWIDSKFDELLVKHPARATPSDREATVRSLYRDWSTKYDCNWHATLRAAWDAGARHAETGDLP